MLPQTAQTTDTEEKATSVTRSDQEGSRKSSALRDK